MKKQTKYYLIYQITNNLNHKIYIGKHKTDNLDDNYFGSGQHLRNAQEKYGLENFTKTILFYCANEEEMNLLEKTVVTPEFCAREDVYNIMEGGNGGWNYVNLSCDYGAKTKKRQNAMHLANTNVEFIQKRAESCSNFWKELKQTNLDAFNDFCKNVSNGVKDFYKQNPGILSGENNPMYGYKYSDEQIKRFSAAKLGQKNPAFGKHWIYNDVLKLSFLVGDNLIWDYLAAGWIIGRKMFNLSEQSRKNIQNGARKANSGKICITNGQINIYVFVDSNLPEGFWIGSKTKNTKCSEKQRIKLDVKKKEHKAKKYKELKPIYDLFKQEGFEAVVKQYNITTTRNNLVMAFKAYIPEYIPFACNRWKNKKLELSVK